MVPPRFRYGLLQHDFIDEFLIFTFAVSAHAQTRGACTRSVPCALPHPPQERGCVEMLTPGTNRTSCAVPAAQIACSIACHLFTGTWTATECIGSLDRDSSSSGYAAPSQTVLPALLKWMLVFEDPATKILWIGKGLPREWLRPGPDAEPVRDSRSAAGGAGADISVRNSPTRYGRLSFLISVRSPTKVIANITLLPGPTTWPPGGLRLRLRLPGFRRGARITASSVGTVNATAETVDIWTLPSDGLRSLESIEVTTIAAAA